MSSALSEQSNFGPETAGLDAAASLLERLALDVGEPAERPRVRRALGQAVASSTADVELEWWHWLAVAVHSLGLRAKAVDATYPQLAELVDDGARVLLRVGEAGEWLAILGMSGSRFRVQHGSRKDGDEHLDEKELRDLLQLAGDEARTHILLVEPATTVYGRHVTEHAATPYDRLWGLIAPEWSDIWIIIVFATINGLLALATPLAVETLVNTVAFGQLMQPIIILAIILLGFLSFSSAIVALQTWVVEIIQRRLFARVSADLAFRLPRARIEALEAHVPRELVNRFFDVMTVQKSASKLLLEGISLILGTLIGMLVLAFYHPWLLGFDVVLLALITFIVFVLGRNAVSTSIKESKSKYIVAAWLEDLAASPTAFRYDAAAEFAMSRADGMTYDYLMARKAHFRILMRQIIFALGLQALASTVLLGLGGWLVISGQLTLGQLVAAELIVTVIVGSFAKLGKHLETFYDMLAAVDKLGLLFDLPIERDDGQQSLHSEGPAAVQLRNVAYARGGGVSRLKPVTLDIPAGERVVLTGSSGTGKSLLLELLFGMRLPTSGHVAIDGVDLRDVQPDALRRRVALVRDIEVFSGSVAENIHLERGTVSARDVRAALEAVGLLRDVLKLPNGIDTELREGGFPLTTNQARRLMVARAIAARPGLLLVDATLDALPDAEVKQLIRLLTDLERPWTLIIVTGRDLVAGAAPRVESFDVQPNDEGDATDGK